MIELTQNRPVRKSDALLKPGRTRRVLDKRSGLRVDLHRRQRTIALRSLLAANHLRAVAEVDVLTKSDRPNIALIDPHGRKRPLARRGIQRIKQRRVSARTGSRQKASPACSTRSTTRSWPHNMAAKAAIASSPPRASCSIG